MAGGAGALSGLCYALAGVYGLLCVWSLRKLVQLWRASVNVGDGCGCGAWSSQRTLHVLMLIVGLGAWAGGRRWVEGRREGASCDRSRLGQPLLARPPTLTHARAPHRSLPRAVRVAFFALVPDWSSDFFYGRMSTLRSESWQFVLDELPSLLLVSLASAHVLIWCAAGLEGWGRCSGGGGPQGALSLCFPSPSPAGRVHRATLVHTHTYTHTRTHSHPHTHAGRARTTPSARRTTPSRRACCPP